MVPGMRNWALQDQSLALCSYHSTWPVKASSTAKGVLYFRTITWKKPSILHSCYISLTLPYLVLSAWTKSQYFVWGWGGDLNLQGKVRVGLSQEDPVKHWYLNSSFLLYNNSSFPQSFPITQPDVANFISMTPAMMALHGKGLCHHLPLSTCTSWGSWIF